MHVCAMPNPKRFLRRGGTKQAKVLQSAVSSDDGTLAKVYSRPSPTCASEPSLFGITPRNLVLIDGPLLQRASRVESLIYHESIIISITISPEPPRGFSGVQKLVERGRMVGIWQAGIDVAEPWKAGRSIEAPGVAREGACYGKMLAPAITFHDGTYAIRDMPAETMLNNATFSWSDIPVTGPNPAFFVLIAGPGIHNGTHAKKSALGMGKVNLTYMHEEGDLMMHGGSFYLTRCILQSAVGEYDVAIQDFSTEISRRPRIPITRWALDAQTKDSNTNGHQMMDNKTEKWRDPIPDTVD
ncbi:hypothetical protein AC579_2217 [Pseudocercospora musae]|uniref:Uncharacterized protein n=1 Tax=Pseudocercospora musae TaxID=113226 RepID=A0A139IKY0_9PEZI|nr:hypothetical protein AC579_2217 [Pseudocercospora musae]